MPCVFSSDGRRAPLSFFSISEVYPPKLKTEDKRLHLTLPNVDKYNNVINESGILVPDGSLYLIDLHHLTQGERACHQAVLYKAS